MFLSLDLTISRSKILLYISAMLAFRQATFAKSLEKEKLYERLSAVPSTVVDSLLQRFAEVARGSSTYVLLAFIPCRDSYQ